MNLFIVDLSNQYRGTVLSCLLHVFYAVTLVTDEGTRRGQGLRVVGLTPEVRADVPRATRLVNAFVRPEIHLTHIDGSSRVTESSRIDMNDVHKLCIVRTQSGRRVCCVESDSSRIKTSKSRYNPHVTP